MPTLYQFNPQTNIIGITIFIIAWALIAFSVVAILLWMPDKDSKKYNEAKRKRQREHEMKLAEEALKLEKERTVMLAQQLRDEEERRRYEAEMKYKHDKHAKVVRKPLTDRTAEFVIPNPDKKIYNIEFKNSVYKYDEKGQLVKRSLKTKEEVHTHNHPEKNIFIPKPKAWEVNDYKTDITDIKNYKAEKETTLEFKNVIDTFNAETQPEIVRRRKRKTSSQKAEPKVKLVFRTEAGYDKAPKHIDKKEYVEANKSKSKKTTKKTSKK